jgi:acyl-CoA synthetase (AMP-forming)/AMP-acid ligase II
VILEHPAVHDVVVVGLPDVEWGEIVAAVIVLEGDQTATDGEIKSWVAGRLRSSRTPAVVEFRDALPYNDTGKVLRRVLRTELAAVRAEA